MPIPRGGGAKLADALVALIRANGGTCEAGVHVSRVFTGGVHTASGDTITAARAVICNVTPTQLYGHLLDGYGAKAERFRYGRSEMQIHFALSEPPQWDGDERLGGTAIVHLTPGLDGVSRAVNEAERGLLPAEATVVAGQPLTMDPSRAPDGQGHPLDPAAGAAVAHQGRRRGRARRRRRNVEREPARALRRPHPGAARAAHPEPRVVDPRPRLALAGRSAGGEHQPRQRRPVRRLARARPELPLATARVAAGAPHAGRRRLAHRRVDASRDRGSAAAAVRSSRSSCSSRRSRSAWSAACAARVRVCS